MTSNIPHAIDLDGLARFLEDAGRPLGPPTAFDVLGQGKSNLTFALTDASGRRAVLRRPPTGPLLPTAHDVLREARIMAALAPTGLPVPKVLATCSDPEVIGAPFALFELVDGVSVHDRRSAGAQTEPWRSQVGLELVAALGDLHALAPAELGLADLARPGAYVERQLRRWHQQWTATADGTVPLMGAVHDRLAADPPTQQRAVLVHSDPKLDNCVFGRDGRLRALVDWELATIGDPLADLGLLLAYWAEADDGETALQDPPSAVHGFATRTELVARYRATTDLDLSELPVYLAFSYWKIGCIVQGVLARRRRSGEASDGVAPFERQVARLAVMAAAALDA